MERMQNDSKDNKSKHCVCRMKLRSTLYQINTNIEREFTKSSHNPSSVYKTCNGVPSHVPQIASIILDQSGVKLPEKKKRKMMLMWMMTRRKKTKSNVLQEEP